MSGLKPSLIDELVSELKPIRPLCNRRPLVLLVMALVLGLAAVAAGLGPRADVIAGRPHPIVLLRTGVLLTLAGMFTVAALSCARPGVNRRTAYFRQMLAATLLAAAALPASALAMAIAQPDATLRSILQWSAPMCLAVSLSAAMVFGSVMVAHLRRGAPVSLDRAGWLVGMGSGSLGVLTYSLHCPTNSLAYIGTWYSLAIATAALAGRLLVPRLIRW